MSLANNITIQSLSFEGMSKLRHRVFFIFAMLCQAWMKMPLVIGYRVQLLRY